MPTQSSLEEQQLIDAAEEVRTTSVSVEKYQQKIKALRESLAANPLDTRERILQALAEARQIMNLDMQAAGKSWQLPEYVSRMEDTKNDLLEFHLNEAFQKKTSSVIEAPQVGETNFEIEFTRDAAKYLAKLGSLTNNKLFHDLSAELLDKVIKTYEAELSPPERIKPVPEREGYFLAQFEKLIQQDLSGKEVNAEEVFYFADLLAEQDAKDDKVQNWDRQAAVAWWMFEFAVRHKETRLRQIAWKRVIEATKARSAGVLEKIPVVREVAVPPVKVAFHMQYVLTRLSSNILEMRRRTKFQELPEDERIAITEELNLPTIVKE